jgi:hypothetical protein
MALELERAYREMLRARRGGWLRRLVSAVRGHG